MSLVNFSGIIISHLGNISGRQEAQENTLPYVRAALRAGWHVCIDVVYAADGFFLTGQGAGQAVPPVMLASQFVWCRAKDPFTVTALCDMGAHVVPATTAPIALTTAQFLWTLPGTHLTPRSIAVFPELTDPAWLDCEDFAGICTNTPADYA